jgi:hypothetical protein
MYQMHSTFSVECEKSSTPPHSIHVWLVQLRGTHDPGHSPSHLTDADADLPMLSCITLSFFLYFSFSSSHPARITQVHPSCDPTVRSRSVDVRPGNSPATTPHIVMAQVTVIIWVYAYTDNSYICATEPSAPETRRSGSVSRHRVYELTHRTHDLRYFYPVLSRIACKNTTTVA